MSGPAEESDGARDPRLIDTGRRIPGKRYCDQPYVVVNDDGSWMCVMTTGAGVEGERGQHVVATRSTDRGRTWSEPVALEPPDGPEASWAVPLRTAAGRIYVFYTFNAENLREVRADDPPYPGGVCRRVDSLGAFVYRFSDDGGRTWSARRWEIPVRAFSIDRENPYQGRVRFFWSVAKPFIHERRRLPVRLQGGRIRGGFLHPVRGDAPSQRQPRRGARSRPASVGDPAARGGGNPGASGKDSRGAQRRSPRRLPALLRLPDHGRLQRSRVQPRRRSHLERPCLHDLRSGRAPLQEPAGRELRPALLERQVPVLVPQPRPGGNLRRAAGQRALPVPQSRVGERRHRRGRARSAGRSPKSCSTPTSPACA